MGCASSNPLVEGGKNLMDNAKEATDNVITMGEKAMQDAGDAVTAGMDNLKSTLESGLQTAQDSIGSVVNNLENTMGMAKEKTDEMVNEVSENVTETVDNVAAEVMEEVSSDTKTVLAFEDATTQEIADKAEALKDQFGEMVEQVENKVEETLHVEEVEEVEDNVANGVGGGGGTQAIDESSGTATDKTDNDAAPVIDEPPEEVKEQRKLKPTPWEAAADAILVCGMMAKTGRAHNDITSHSAAETEVSKLEGKLDNNNSSDILLSDTISIKSYKSEI